MLAAALAVAVRPHLWITALRQLLVLARPGWWPRRLPLPDRRYMELRMVTAYGDPSGPARAEDVVSYLNWCRAWPRLKR